MREGPSGLSIAGAPAFAALCRRSMRRDRRALHRRARRGTARDIGYHCRAAQEAATMETYGAQDPGEDPRDIPPVIYRGAALDHFVPGSTTPERGSR